MDNYHKLLSIPIRTIDIYLSSNRNITPNIQNILILDDNDTDSKEWYRVMMETCIIKRLNIIKKSIRSNSRLRIIPNNPLSIFSKINPDKIKVILCGQDPYPNPKHACGISFASNSRTTPKSLSIIFSELRRTHPYSTKYLDNSLRGWLEQGILPLNASLTLPLRDGKTDKTLISEHRELWSSFILSVISHIVSKSPNVIIVCLGSVSSSLITSKVSCVYKILRFPHPMANTYSKTNKPFVGSDFYLEIDKQLLSAGEEISWCTARSINNLIIECSDELEDCMDDGCLCLINKEDINYYNLQDEPILYKGHYIKGYFYCNKESLQTLQKLDDDVHLHILKDDLNIKSFRFYIFAD